METLYDAWLERIESYYEAQYFESVIDELVQFRGGGTVGREAKGKIFNAGYEVFIYAFFIGLYYGERRPLNGEKRKFRVTMKEWGRKGSEPDRQSYTILQKYIFAALVAKSNIDLLALDKGELDVKEACDVLMTTLNEYANMGFFLMSNEMKRNMGLFFENDGLLKFLKQFVP